MLDNQQSSTFVNSNSLDSTHITTFNGFDQSLYGFHELKYPIFFSLKLIKTPGKITSRSKHKKKQILTLFFFDGINNTLCHPV